MNKKLFPTISLKTSILIPLVLVLVTLISGFTYAYIHQEKMATQKHIGDQFLSAKNALKSAVQIETEKLSATLMGITANQELKHAMMAGDQDALLKQSSTLFNTLREKYHITHFYFHRPDRVNFLRIHQPNRHGDMINRFSALQAEATGEPASALETGPLGLFTLRVVSPWYENKKLIGYVELGEEIEHIYRHIKNVVDIDLFVIINKKILSRAGWETGMKILKRKAEWDLLPTSVIAFSTMPDSNNLINHFMESDSLGQITVEGEKKERTFKTYSLPLSKVGQDQQEIGSMFFLRDITDIKEKSIHDILRAVWFGSGIGGMLLLLFFLLTRRIEEKLESSKKGLVKSEARFRALVESSSDMIWEVDASGHYVYVSPNIEDLLGYKADEIIGKTPFELMPEEEAGRIGEEFASIVKERRLFTSLENANQHKDGRIVILESSGVPILDKDGVLSGYRGIDRNITKRIKSEQALSKARERLLLFFKQSPFSIMEWDPDFKVLEWNPAAEKIFGYTKAEAMGRKVEDLIIPENIKAHISEIRSALLSNKGGFRSINENVTKEGNTIVCSWHNTPLIDASGKIIGVSSIAEDVTIQEESKRKIEYMAYYDTLTGLPNRTLFKDRLEQECLYADREKSIVGILFMGIDHFKVVNDTKGHLIGDRLLKEVAHRLRDNFRASDTVSRFSGDTFAIIIPYLSQIQDIYPILKSVIHKFEIPFKIYEFEFFVTFSTGITFYPLDDKEHNTLLRDADTAMYHAKTLGRNQYQRYNSEMTQEVNKRFSLQNDLRQAIDHEEFILYYQPQVDSNSGMMKGVEALIRWQHPQKGLISTMDFIPIAEQTGLIVPIGEWILRTACKQVKAWQKQGHRNITMAVNLSSRQFRDEGFAQSVINIKNEYELEPNQLELELTESILMDNDDSVFEALQSFKEEGILLAIDDFGTGYSSLSYLNLFPIDKLKIDQSFTKNVTNDPKIATLVRAIISMAKALGLETIAEGVETQEDQDFIQKEGCDTIQGYFTGRPMSAEQIQEFLKNR